MHIKSDGSETNATPAAVATVTAVAKSHKSVSKIPASSWPACDGVLLANGQNLQQRNVKLLFVHRHTSSTRRNKRCSKHTLAGTLAIFSLFVVQRNVGVYVCTCVCVYLDLFTQHRVSKYTKYTTCTKC